MVISQVDARCSSQVVSLGVAVYVRNCQSMIPRIQHLLLITLFVAAQLILQPLMATGWCMDAAAQGAGCCCDAVTSALEATAPVASLAAVPSCCSRASAASDSDEKPSGPGVEHSGCQCADTPSAPLTPERNSSFTVESGEAAAEHEAEENLTHLSVWPNRVATTKRQPHWPPMLVREAEPAFRQVFRI